MSMEDVLRRMLKNPVTVYEYDTLNIVQMEKHA
jgi:hypothetical protein